MFTTLAFSQDIVRTDSKTVQSEKPEMKWRRSFGSTLLLLGNIEDSVNYLQFNYGYRLTQKDNIIAEVITWTYYEPLGTYMHSKEYYPGKVRAIGIGLGYLFSDLEGEITTTICKIILR